MKGFKATDLTPHAELESAWETKIDFSGNEVSLHFIPDDLTLEDTLKMGNRILQNLAGYEKKAKDILVEEFLESYNEDWREEDEDEPELDEEAFRDQIHLHHIEFLGDSSIDFYYNDGGLFGGHSLIAQSFDGENFTDANMYG